MYDGKRVDDLSSVDPLAIESVEVIKDSVKLIPFGAEGRAGVVKIKTK